MGLPGVRVGPLDPDRTAQFGQVSQKNSARQLIRIHAQAYPLPLRKALSLAHDEPRSRGLDMDEVRDYLAGLSLENGDPLVPTGARVVGAAVHGQPDKPQTLTFTYRVAGSGRTAKWFAPYDTEALPVSYADGSERARIAELRARGVAVTEDSLRSAPPKPAQAGADRENARLRAELEKLRAAIEEREDGDGDGDGDGDSENDVNDALSVENARLREELEAARSDAPEQSEPAVAADEPMEGYDDLKSAEVIKLVKSKDTSDAERQAILDYEANHQNRRGVVGAVQVALGDRGAA